MPVAIKGTGGGSVTLDAGAAAADTTLTLPNVTGTVLQSGTTVTVAQGGTGAATLTANAVLIGNGTSAVTAVAPSTAGNVLTSNGTTWASTAPSSPVSAPTAVGQIPFSTNGSTYTATQKITQGTSVAASGTAVNFTGIPSWAKRITMIFNGLSLNGSSTIMLQIGTGGTPTASGYTGVSNLLTIGSYVGPLYTTGFIIGAGSYSSDTYYGTATLNLMVSSSNTWVFNCMCAMAQSANYRGQTIGGGILALSGALDNVSIASFNTTDSFDTGTINILYE
jgi:hypothetical protein